MFSTLIGKPDVNISTALAYNLMGALFGGLMEYNSMYFGFAFLYLLAMGFYGLAWVFSVESVVAMRRLAAAARRLVANLRELDSKSLGRTAGAFCSVSR